MPLGPQLRLPLDQAADLRRDRIVVSAPNRDAVETLDAWPDKQGGALALIGPAGVGKSHLAAAWAQRTNARRLEADDLALGRPETAGCILLDGADEAAHGEAFFHLMNWAFRPGSALLLVGRTPPSTWSVEVADLRSRLNALRVIEVGEPDDTILKGVLIKLFRQRNVRPPADLLAYLVRRMERSAPAAAAIVRELDDAALAEHRPVSRALARELFKDDADEPKPEDEGSV